MQKSKLGMSMSLLAALIFFTGLLGITPLLLIAGYVILVEQNEYLKSCATKAVLIVVLTTAVAAVVGILLGNNSILGLIDDLVRVFAPNSSINLAGQGSMFAESVPFIGRLQSFIQSSISLIRTVALVLFGALALIKDNYSIKVEKKTQ